MTVIIPSFAASANGDVFIGQLREEDKIPNIPYVICHGVMFDIFFR
jgi:hypothetical protein